MSPLLLYRTVVCATIALCHDIHTWNRINVEHYLEVPLVELQQRDTKGVYEPSTTQQDVWGIGLSAEFPKTPDIKISNFGSITPKMTAKLMFDHYAATALR